MLRRWTTIGSDPTELTRERPDARWAFLTFLGVALGAFVFYISLGRKQWFFADEWSFLSAHGIGGRELIRAHYGHWVAVPLVAYRALWQIFGLRSYVPYVGLAIALHLVAAGLLWVVMRRAQVRPWTATLVASVFVLFGAGAQDILWAFQITFTGAFVFGLVQLLLTDHDGPIDFRDWIGLGAGLLGLMCSGVAVTMVVVVGVASLLRRSGRAAAFNTVPLGVVYGAWWLAYSHGKYSFRGSPRQILDWFFSGAGGTFSGLASVRGVGWFLAALLIGGGVLIVRGSGVVAARRRLALPIAMLVGAAVFLLVAAFDRSAIGWGAARSGRYLHILAALVLPVIAVAIDAALDRSRVLGIAAIAVLLVGVPGNVQKAKDYSHQQRLVDNATRSIMLSVGGDPLAQKVPRSLRPEPNRAPTVTIGWLIDGARSGRIPAGPTSPFVRRTNRLRLSLMELDHPSGYACRPLRAGTTLVMHPGEKLGVTGRIAVVLLTPRGRSGVVQFGNGFLNPGLRHTLVAVAGPLRLRMVPVGSFGAALCPAPKA